MRTLPANILTSKNMLKSDAAWLMLLDVVLPDSTLLQFVRNHADVVAARNIYTNANVVAHYKMNDDAANTTVTDSSQNETDATLEGGDNTEDVTTTGKIGAGFALNGVDDDVNTNQTFESTFQGSFSISMWVCPDDGNPSANQDFFGVSDSGGGSNDFVVVRMTTNGGIIFYYDANSHLAEARTNSVVFANGQETWHHVVVVADATVSGVNGLKIYFDGQLIALNVSYQGDTSSVVFADYSSTRNPLIGANQSDASKVNFYDGKVDNVIIFNKALSAAEVARLYNDGNGTELVPNTYTGANFTLDQTSDEGQGRIPQWQLKIANAARILESYLEAQGGAVASLVTMTVVNSKYLSEDYTELEKTFEVIDCTADSQWVTFTLGAPNMLRQRFPLRKFLALHCAWDFSWSGGECSYASYSVADLSFGGGSEEVVVTVNDLSFEDGRDLLLSGCSGISPAIAGVWAASYLDANRLELIGSDSSDYSGSYGGDGTAGWNDCLRTPADCKKHFNQTRFGGAPGMRAGGVKFA